ncbi:MAG: hypothetical protein RMK84_18055 [Oscillochloridaceae bacterium]|nr:hypothetical protein [Chloroflexaceae bacterium]MDW8392029.1 hypothetical protein [Oscillochloridaceae bacterium]
MTLPVALFLILTAVAALFQLALALGAPWGAYTLGGRFPGQLPPRMRLAALAQMLALLLFAAIVLARSGLAFEVLYPFSRVAIWFVAGFFVLGALANLATPSRGERLLWGPVNVLLLIAAILIAIGP